MESLEGATNKSAGRDLVVSENEFSTKKLLPFVGMKRGHEGQSAYDVRE